MMKRQQYHQILRVIQTKKNFCVLSHLKQEFPNICEDTFSSIYSQEIQKKVKKNFHRINSSEMSIDLYQRYQSSVESREPPGILVRMSQEIDYSPAMLSKAILEQYLCHKFPNITVTKSQLNRLLRNTKLIEDQDLSYEVYLCLLQDDVYGPFADTIKHSIGHEYEFLLCKELEKLNISFHDEDELRVRGYDKTPDIKLTIPVAVDGHVINWIESKASFGDEESHRTYLKDQFWSYWNRFGPGLVIYWFGFIEELDEHREKGIILRDSFPTNITFMDPLSVTDTTGNSSHRMGSIKEENKER